MSWEEVHVKWCWMEKVDLGAEIVVEESLNLQVLHWPTPHGKVPQSGGDSSWGRLLCTRVSRMCVEERLGGYWRKWLKFQGHFSRYENSS